MIADARDEAAALTEYEAAQVARIAAWKSEHPLIIGELYRLVADRVADVVERVIPDAPARQAIHWIYDAAEATARRNEVVRWAGARALAELHEQPLEACDRLAHLIGRNAELVAAAEGALTGAGGALTTLLDVPLLFGVALRTIIRIGYCYGYPLDRKTDRAYVLGVLVAALANTRERKQHLLVRLKEIEHLLLEEAQENLLAEEAASFLFQLEVFEEIPGVGAVSGAVLNYGSLARIERAARHVFQERWLRDHGKVEHIEPAPDTGRVPASGDWAGVLARAAYSGSYYLGFGAAFPFYAVASLLPRDSAAARGVHDGVIAATDGVNQVFDRLRGALRRLPPTPEAAGAPA